MDTLQTACDFVGGGGGGGGGAGVGGGGGAGEGVVQKPPRGGGKESRWGAVACGGGVCVVAMVGVGHGASGGGWGCGGVVGGWEGGDLETTNSISRKNTHKMRCNKDNVSALH